MYSLASLPTSVSSLTASAQDVAGRVVGQVEVVDEPLGLGALAGPRGPEKDEVLFAQTRGGYFRKPS